MESRIQHSTNKLRIAVSVMIVFFFNTIISFAQELDSVKVDSLLGVTSKDIDTSKNHYLEIYKLSSRRTFKLVEGRQVRIYSHKIKNNRVRTKSAVISKIEDHQVTFTPASKKFEAVTLAVSDLIYLEILTAGSVLSGIVIDGLLLSVVVATVGVIVVVALVSAFSGGPSFGSGNGLGNFIGILPWNNFHKHIKVFNPRGIQKWGVRIVGS